MPKQVVTNREKYTRSAFDFKSTSINRVKEKKSERENITCLAKVENVHP